MLGVLNQSAKHLKFAQYEVFFRLWSCGENKLRPNKVNNDIKLKLTGMSFKLSIKVSFSFLIER